MTLHEDISDPKAHHPPPPGAHGEGGHDHDDDHIPAPPHGQPAEHHKHSKTREPMNIFEAAIQGNDAWLVRRIERELDFDINTHDKWLKRTALHYAVDEGHAKVVETLLDYGADASLADANERTAFHIAALRADEPIMRLLIASVKEGDRLKALINAPDKFSLTPAFLAHQARGADHGAFILLLTNGAHWDD